LKDTFRQDKGIEERYRRGLVAPKDIKKIVEPSFKYHWACSRGYERHLLEHINGIENEHLNRQWIKPDVK
jgi:hypothetical protein